VGSGLLLRYVCLCAAALLALPSAAVAQTSDGRHTEIGTAHGHYHATRGFSDRAIASLWGNALAQNGGFGVHAEVHRLRREETAGFFVGGLSYNTGPLAPSVFIFKGLAGSSTDKQMILPEVFARGEVAWRSDPVAGLVITPSVTYRQFRNGAHETALETQGLKYVPISDGTSLIFSGLVRWTLIDPGRHSVPAFGAGLTYSVYQRYSLGFDVEAGRASYNSISGGVATAATVNDRYYSLRPHASVFLSDRVELFAAGEYTDRESYKILGGIGGVKFYLQ
jgi:hypothetical protein